MKTGVYVLTCDIKNPLADRRSGDWKRSPVWEKGKLFCITNCDVGPGMYFLHKGYKPGYEGKAALGGEGCKRGDAAYHEITPYLTLHEKSDEILALQAKAEAFRHDAWLAEEASHKLAKGGA